MSLQLSHNPGAARSMRPKLSAPPLGLEEAFQLVSASASRNIHSGGSQLSPARLPLSEALKERVRQIQRRNKPTGHHPLISHCKAFDRVWGEREIASISYEEIEDWVCLRRSEVKDSTIVAQLAQLRKAFDWAVKSGHVSSNPVRLIDLKFQKAGHRSRRLSRAEEVRLRNAYAQCLAECSDLSFVIKWGCAHLEWSAVRFAILTGCRRMEQLQLTAESIEAREVEEGRVEYWLHIRDGKTGPRSIPLHPEAHEIACKWLSLPRPVGSPWVFWPHQVEHRFSLGLRHYNRVFAPICKAAGLVDFHWHDLRRTFACRLIEQEVPIFEVQRLLGHTDPKMTMIYACVEPGRLRDSVLKMWSHECAGQ